MLKWLVAWGAALAVYAGGTSIAARQAPAPAAGTAAPDTPQGVVTRSCVSCHNDRTRAGNLSLQTFDVATAAQHAETAEKMIRKLRAGQMPPPGSRRPSDAMLDGLADALEAQADAHAASDPTPGRRTFQRLNRAEYARSVHDLLGLDVNAGDYLPLDTKSANFDNIADAQLLSPTLMQAYLTRGGRDQPAGGGRSRGDGARSHLPGVALDLAARARRGRAVRHARRGLGGAHVPGRRRVSLPRLVLSRDDRRAVRERSRGAAHRRSAGADRDLDRRRARRAARHRSLDEHVGSGRREPAHRSDQDHRRAAPRLGRVHPPPRRAGAGSDLAARLVAREHQHRRRLRLHDAAAPARPRDHRPVRGHRRVGDAEPPEDLHLPRRNGAATGAVRARDRLAPGVAGLPPPGHRTRSAGADAALQRAARPSGFEAGVRMALEGILASPRFVFRFEERPTHARPARPIASTTSISRRGCRSSCGRRRPTRSCCGSRRAGKLSTPAGSSSRRGGCSPIAARDVARHALRRAVAAAAGSRQDQSRRPTLSGLRRAARRRRCVRETELFFQHIVREDRAGARPLLAPTTRSSTSGSRSTTAFPDVVGNEFRKVHVSGRARRGLLGHGSILTQTSHADRTSPVLRGKWVMEVLLGTPPPPPPPDVPDLEATAEAEDGRLRTVRERMEQHRANPACTSCHQMIDPIGLALENFDVTGAWRIKDNGMPVDARERVLRRHAADRTRRICGAALLKRPPVAGAHVHREPDDLRAGPPARATPTCRRCAASSREARGRRLQAVRRSSWASSRARRSG